MAGEAVAAAAAEVADLHAAAEGEQVEMFALPTRFVGAEADEQAARVERARGKAGRPPGAVNRSTALLRDYLLARGVSPLEQMFRWALHTPETLAAELDCSKKEAFLHLRQLWADLAPYLHARQAPVDDTGKPVPIFNLQFGATGGDMAAQIGTGSVPPWGYLEGEAVEVEADDQAEENQ